MAYGRIYHMAQCQGALAQMEKLFWSLPSVSLAKRCCENVLSAKGPLAMDISSGQEHG